MRINLPPVIDSEDRTWVLTYEGRVVATSYNLDTLRNQAPTAILTSRAEAATKSI